MQRWKDIIIERYGYGAEPCPEKHHGEKWKRRNWNKGKRFRDINNVPETKENAGNFCWIYYFQEGVRFVTGC